MFAQPSVKEAPKSVKSSHKLNKATRKKRRKKLARKLKRQAQEAANALNQSQSQSKPDPVVQKSNIEISMSSWAENFTTAATWQLKHQVAHWKARVKALEYENKVLRDTLRKHFAGVEGDIPEICRDSDAEHPETEKDEENDEINESSALETASIATEDISVDEEYIQYAMETLASREQEKRIAESQEKEVKEPEPVDTTEVLKQLYGDKWQRIAALESSLQTYFMSECDKQKPVYWPNMPLNC